MDSRMRVRGKVRMGIYGAESREPRVWVGFGLNGWFGGSRRVGKGIVCCAGCFKLEDRRSRRRRRIDCTFLNCG